MPPRKMREGRVEMDSGRVLPVETSEQRKDSCQIGMQTLAQRSIRLRREQRVSLQLRGLRGLKNPYPFTCSFVLRVATDRQIIFFRL